MKDDNKIDNVDGDYVKKNKYEGDHIEQPHIEQINIESHVLNNPTFENNSGYRPPTEHDLYRSCPQCGERAWLYTDVHQTCGFDIAAYDIAMNRKAFEQRRMIFLAVMFVVCLMAMSWMKYFGNSSTAALVMLLGLGGIMIALKG